MFSKFLSDLAVPTATAAPAFAGDALSAFDVAEDQTRFSFAPAPVFDDDMPARSPSTLRAELLAAPSDLEESDRHLS